MWLDHGESSTPIQSILIYSMFVLPVVTGFMFYDNVLDSSIIEKRGFTSSKQVVEKQQQAGAFDGSGEKEESSTSDASDTSRAEAYLDDPDSYMENPEEAKEGIDEKLADAPLEHPEGFEVQAPPEGYYEELKAEMLEMDTIVVDDDRYIPMMNIIDMNVKEFVGKRIEILGFVYRESDFTKIDLLWRDSVSPAVWQTQACMVHYLICLVHKS